MTNKDDRTSRGWLPAAVGCHWTRGEFHISTIAQGDRHGYCVVRDRIVLAEFVTWEQAEALAERRVKRGQSDRA